MPREDYMKLMREKLRERTALVIAERGKPAVGREALKRVVPGTRPKRTKTSGRMDHRPRVLSKDQERRKRGNTWYFSIYYKYKEASAKYRKGDLTVEFPAGTYRPPSFTIGYEGTVDD